MLPESLPPPILIESEPDLRALASRLASEPRCGVDTEANSLHAYRERVCLIQLSTGAADYVIDPLAVADLSPLAAFFADAHIEKIFHAAEYDLVGLRRDYAFRFAGLFDTMQAGRILGRKLAGLDRLLEDKFGVKVSKRLQKADWGVRPLSRELLLYARLDTHYLSALRDLLQAELESRGLAALAAEDFQMACAVNGGKPKVEAPSWARFAARRDLTPRELTILNELSACREQVAARLDRPPFKVAADDQLIAIARARPSTPQELAELHVTARQLQMWGAPMLNALQRGLQAPLVRRTASVRPPAVYLKRLDQLKRWRKKAAAEMDVESDVVLPRPLMLALAERGPAELPAVLQVAPWRLEHFGAQILEALGG